MATYLDYAQLSGRTYFRTRENRTPLTGGWEERQWQSDNAITGFSAGTYVQGDEIVIAFTGSNETLFKDFAVVPIPAIASSIIFGTP